MKSKVKAQPKNEIIQGNEAISLGALDSGVEFYAGYPITPASEIMHHMANDKSVKFIQSEDELAAIHHIIGASLAGNKVMTATSGPGFSLMQEGLSFAYKLRLPLVVVNSMRMGPSTGMPTIGSQQDISLVGSGPHGDTIPVAFYPNSVEEAYKLTKISFEVSEKLKTPVILLSDGFLSHMYENFDLKRTKSITKRKEKSLGNSNRYFSGLVLDKNMYPATTNIKEFQRWLEKYKKEIFKGIKDYDLYEYSGNKKSNTLIISYGITSRLISDLKNKFAFFRPIRMFPVLDTELKSVAKKYKKIVVIEMNNGQYSKEVERALKKNIKTISIYGIDFNLNEIERKILSN